MRTQLRPHSWLLSLPTFPPVTRGLHALPVYHQRSDPRIAHFSKALLHMGPPHKLTCRNYHCPSLAPHLPNTYTCQSSHIFTSLIHHSCSTCSTHFHTDKPIRPYHSLSLECNLIRPHRLRCLCHPRVNFRLLETM